MIADDLGRASDGNPHHCLVVMGVAHPIPQRSTALEFLSDATSD